MFDITVVCTGNRNRSPIAEAALTKAAAGLPLRVGSVGLLDLGSQFALPETIAVAGELGLDISSHRSRHLGSVDISTEDLVLGLEWAHVAAAVVEGGVPHDRAFTLQEVVMLLRTLDSKGDGSEDRARYLVAQANQRRAERPTSLGQADIKDPFGGHINGYRRMAETVTALSKELISSLFGVQT